MNMKIHSYRSYEVDLGNHDRLELVREPNDGGTDRMWLRGCFGLGAANFGREITREQAQEIVLMLQSALAIA